MKRMKLLNMGAMMLLVLIAAGLPACRKNADVEAADALSHTKRYTADVATKWFTLLTDITRTRPYFSPQALRIFAYSGLALYESVVPGMPSHQSMYQHLTGSSIAVDKKKDYYWPACANAAIARVATKVMQQYPAPNLTSVEALEASLNTSYQTEVSPEQLQFSNEFGRYVADLVWEWSRSDGTFHPDGTAAACPPYLPKGGPGNWVPTPPAFLPAAGVCQGNIRTFVPNIVNTVLAPPPPAYSTDPNSPFYLAAKEVFDARNNITADETKQFNNWRDLAPNFSPLAHMLRIATAIFTKEQLNLEDAATLYAKLTMAASDAIGAVFFSKYHYSLLRPATYIRGVMGQGSWLSLPSTPQTPSYPEESSPTASSITILENHFGTNYSFIDSVHKATHGEWAYNSFGQMMDVIVQARVSGGTNFRFAGHAGKAQGRRVGEVIDHLPFKKGDH